jgi:cytosine/adenosine deaminase-related metal-dependent hydrolase
MWTEARNALLLGRLRGGLEGNPGVVRARDALHMATRDGAKCLGRDGEIGVLQVGAAADIAVWSLTGPSFSGAVSDPVEAWLRCGPTSATHTIIDGRVVVEHSTLMVDGLEDRLHRHRLAAERIQAD